MHLNLLAHIAKQCKQAILFLFLARLAKIPFTAIEGASELLALKPDLLLVGADALEVSSVAPAVALVGVLNLAPAAADDESPADVEGVDGAVEGEAPLFAPGQGDGLSVHNDLELGHDTEEALLLLDFQFTLGLVVLRLLRFGGRRVGRGWRSR